MLQDKLQQYNNLKRNVEQIDTATCFCDAMYMNIYSDLKHFLKLIPIGESPILVSRPMERNLTDELQVGKTIKCQLFRRHVTLKQNIDFFYL